MKIVYLNRKCCKIEDNIKGNLFTCCILDLDVITFQYEPIVGFDIFYHAIKFQMLNRSRALKSLQVVQQSVLKFKMFTV